MEERERDRIERQREMEKERREMDQEEKEEMKLRMQENAKLEQLEEERLIQQNRHIPSYRLCYCNAESHN
jgi:hypothetical protein